MTSIPNSITITPITNRRLSLFREIGIAAGLFILWQYLVWLKGRHTPIGAISRGMDIRRMEQWLHIPSEQWLQSATRPIWNLANVYYDLAHICVMATFLAWVIICHRQHWRYIRNLVFIPTFAGLVIQSLWASAPPRFIHIPGLVDTANISGVSIYAAAGHVVDQYSTFPSLHVAWAAIVAFGALRLTRSPIRWIFFSHLVATILAVVITGNHFWLDCVAGICLVLPVSRYLRFDGRGS